MLKDFLETPFFSFKFENFRGYFTLLFITKGFLIALSLSVFIYLVYFGLENKTILSTTTSLSALLGFYFLLKCDKKTLFWSGFFIGLLWFYWIGLSFRFFNLSYLIPLMILFVSLSYGVFFLIIGYLKKSYLRAILFLLFSYFTPLGFNWFIPEVTLVDSIFDFTKLKFGLFLLSLVFIIEFKGYYRVLFLLPLLFSIRYENIELLVAKQSIYISKDNIPQDKKWTNEYQDTLINMNFKTINSAIDGNYDIVLLSESVFALYLNDQPELLKRLKVLSKEITIVAGSLYHDGLSPYNSTYFFIDGEFYVAHKMILVPFSEETPLLPKFVKKLINDTFFNGAQDYKKAIKPTDINIGGEIFRNAICYEATSKELYKGDPKLMFAQSNNAWFTPSIEPTLQKLIMRFYSRIHYTTIYHSASGGISGIVRF
jgi:apolipoprotein N-acyltransferase